MMDMMNGSGSMMGGMGLFFMLSWLFILIGIFFIIKSMFEHKVKESPLEVLAKRYARGEIDSETYQRIKNELNGDES